MKRRTALKWSAPVITAITLPQHAIASPVEQTTTQKPVATTPAPTTPVPTTSNPCGEGSPEVLMCHFEQSEEVYVEICVDPSTVEERLDAGDTLGACPR